MVIRFKLARGMRRSAGLLILTVILTAPAVVLANHQFPDVPTGHPFHAQIDAIAEAGITSGFADGGFHPNDAVTRQAMAAFMHRGLGRVGLAKGTATTTQYLVASPGQSSTLYAPVRTLTLTVPGLHNSTMPKQMVHVVGRVSFAQSMSDDFGCPCEFSAYLRDATGNVNSTDNRQTFESVSEYDYRYSFEVEGLFAAAPGARTFELHVSLTRREVSSNSAAYYFDASTSLSAATFAFGPTGGNTTTGSAAQ